MKKMGRSASISSLRPGPEGPLGQGAGRRATASGQAAVRMPAAVVRPLGICLAGPYAAAMRQKDVSRDAGQPGGGPAGSRGRSGGAVDSALARALAAFADSVGGRLGTGGAMSVPEGVTCLDTGDLSRLAASFDDWVRAARRPDVAAARNRVRLVFLLLRHTGARLGEVLALDLDRDLDAPGRRVFLGDPARREVALPDFLAAELERSRGAADARLLRLDQGHVRRKFYERALALSLPRDLVNPSAIRRSRAIELLREGVPVPVVQRMLGHSTGGLTAAWVEVSDEDRRLIERRVLEREGKRTTSARNAFFGPITAIRRGDIQSEIELRSLCGQTVCSVITTGSLTALGLKVGRYVTAEIKAPWLVVSPGPGGPPTSAANRFVGAVERVGRGRLTSEIIVRLRGGTRLCAVVTTRGAEALALEPGQSAVVECTAFAVILRVD